MSRNASRPQSTGVVATSFPHKAISLNDRGLRRLSILPYCAGASYPPNEKGGSNECRSIRGNSGIGSLTLGFTGNLILHVITLSEHHPHSSLTTQ